MNILANVSDLYTYVLDSTPEILRSIYWSVLPSIAVILQRWYAATELVRTH